MSGRNKHLITAARSFPSRGSHKAGVGAFILGRRGFRRLREEQAPPLQRDRAGKSLLLEGRDALSKCSGGAFVAKAGSNL